MHVLSTLKCWLKVMPEKYIKDGNLFTATVLSSSSLGWKSIVKGYGGQSWNWGKLENQEWKIP